MDARGASSGLSPPSSLWLSPLGSDPARAASLVRLGDTVASVRVVLAVSILFGLGWSAPRAVDAPEFFQTPSKTIGCVFEPAQADQPAYLRCDIATGLVPRPPKPKDCDVDWGFGYEMTKNGRAHGVCAGDTARVSNAKVLHHGTTWRRGGFACVSRRSGLRCTNADRHGFFLSREHTYTI